MAFPTSFQKGTGLGVSIRSSLAIKNHNLRHHPPKTDAALAKGSRSASVVTQVRGEKCKGYWALVRDCYEGCRPQLDDYFFYFEVKIMEFSNLRKFVGGNRLYLGKPPFWLPVIFNRVTSMRPSSRREHMCCAYVLLLSGWLCAVCGGHAFFSGPVLLRMGQASFGRVHMATTSAMRAGIPGFGSGTGAGARVRERLVTLGDGFRDAGLKTTMFFMKQFPPRSVVKTQPHLKGSFPRKYTRAVEREEANHESPPQLSVVKVFMKQFAPRSIIKNQPRLKSTILKGYNDAVVGGREEVVTARERVRAAVRGGGSRVRGVVSRVSGAPSAMLAGWGHRGDWDGRLVGGEDERLLIQASTCTGVAPPWNAPKFVWRNAWTFHQFMLQYVLHRFDPCRPADNCVNLSVLWWKAITGNRKGSVTDDQGLAYDLLPDLTRLLVSWPWAWLYPNLHSQNVALRTQYLNRVVDAEIAHYRRSYGDKVRVVTLGAGFDTRSVALKGNDYTGALTCFELDLPTVIAQKKKMFETYLLRRRPHLGNRLPTLIGRDLNDVDSVVQALTEAGDGPQPTIFVVEAVLMYLQDSKVTDLLQGCVGASMLSGAPAVSVCFADRFPRVGGRAGGISEEDAARHLFRSIGMEMELYQGKPGRARSMGLARASFQRDPDPGTSPRPPRSSEMDRE